MGARLKPMTSPDAGDATGSLPSSSPDRGQSAATAVKPTTDPLDLLLEAPTRQPGPKCMVGTLLLAMPAERAEKVRRLVDELTDRSPAQIAEALQELGYPVSHNQIRHHRARLRGAGCRCQ